MQLADAAFAAFLSVDVPTFKTSHILMATFMTARIPSIGYINGLLFNTHAQLLASLFAQEVQLHMASFPYLVTQSHKRVLICLKEIQSEVEQDSSNKQSFCLLSVQKQERNEPSLGMRSNFNQPPRRMQNGQILLLSETQRSGLHNLKGSRAPSPRHKSMRN